MVLNEEALSCMRCLRMEFMVFNLNSWDDLFSLKLCFPFKRLRKDVQGVPKLLISHTAKGVKKPSHPTQSNPCFVFVKKNEEETTLLKEKLLSQIHRQFSLEKKQFRAVDRMTRFY